ncbi:MAG: ASCH domain-containing protein [Archaeoglobaceae archaeon]|nr:ASCH domain-containing protein [Archaeoglobaceae archaeon]MCX8152059.1 ASCH domain-containing protein [Archaeoglobaceae archaeon]MDW8013824.1 ASCH domain-containing protein [Archaeoglobaceae archaeon]
MEKVNFDPEYVPLIVEGKKKTTIRKGIKSYPVGRLVEFTVENSKVFAIARIKKVVVKRISELTDSDAEIDGFKNKNELLRALRKIYGDVKDSEFVTIIHFEVVKV